MIAAHTYDKFYGTPLDLALRSRGHPLPADHRRDHRHLRQRTVLAAANRDYRVTVVADAVATLWPEIQQACFDIWRRKFARLRTTNEVVEELNSLC